MRHVFAKTDGYQLKRPQTTMCQCLVRREPLRWIQTTNKIFEVRVGAFPQRERLTRVSLVKAVLNNFKNLASRTVAKMLQEPIQSVLVRKLRDLALEDDC